MRMLMPLFRRTSDKRDYRATINPKLVYKNIEVLLQARLLDENESGYELSELGKTVLAEFITFLEKTRKTLNTRTRSLGGEKSNE
jgi:predicted transcriptional regulator